MATHLPIFSRACGDCTKCCEGWLEGNVHGKQMYRGQKCHFLGEKCTIYLERPENPCKSYNCAWLLENIFPEWMKPNICNVIITKRSTILPMESGMKKIDYYDVIEAGDKLNVSMLNWLVQWAVNNQINLAYELDGKMHALGDPDFKKLLMS